MKKKNNKERSILKKIAKLRCVTRTDIMKASGLSAPTVTLYMNNPKLMNGIIRNKISKVLKIDTHTMDDIINGKADHLSDVLKEYESLNLDTFKK